MEKYKIAMISDWYYPKIGGIEYALDSLARNLLLMGHEVHVITRNQKGTDQFTPAEGLTVIRLKGKSLDSRFLVPYAYKELYDILKHGNYDIIHSHGLDSPMALLSLMFSRLLQIPTVITNHSLTGKSLIRIPLHMAGRFFLRYTDAVIAVSSAVQKDTGVMFKGPVYSIPNGVDVLASLTDDAIVLPDTNGKTMVTTVSRMTLKKGVSDIVKIAPELIERNPDLVFLMVGDGPLKKSLEKKVKNQGMENNFIFTGQVSRSVVFSLLERSDIFIMASRDEAFGIAILEAFAKKVPVVARDNSGVSDIITHGKTGFLVEDSGQMLEYLERLIEDQELRDILSENAFSKLDEYKWQDVAKLTSDVYAELIHEKNSHFN
ncbi:Glycosyltransferase involved in cell wall bisynthesis [Methanolobus vulcani]|uniref:Glycosyltransferase involved in cell wall bisynthesis n=1 Tax=Methanolobus vulcani TaxID=38026 RepID=A0A7Z7AXZ5_9EURY|nr:glycosyltransferase family 4 protein [Methanolobus vulcani]MDK2824927.1 hypothetical protein [Methanolobus sp.]MDK2947230.1 hypothetical protein [Methanolobus sp.]SDG11694.1 Glycosyltransferase involved in cell wall bisynthesis [Methanolobus vulcani]